MKILLDENIDVRFKNLFPSAVHDVYTVRDMNWTGVKNGVLLRLLEENGFDRWIVVDKNLPYQQNVGTLPCLIVVFDVFRNTLKQITAMLPAVLNALASSTGKKIIAISEI
jgi:hypothetical protein